MVYRKKYMEKILSFLDTPFVKVLTGVRRCGKSTIMQMIRDSLVEHRVSDDQILFYRLDSLEHEDKLTSAALFKDIRSKLHPEKKTYIFLDEIQEVQEWEKLVNSLMTDFDVDIFVTGSNSRMMSGEISTYLTGRYVSFRIYPLTFSEYLEFRKTYARTGSETDELARFLHFGGFPALHLREYSAEEAYIVVRDIYNSTVFTDIVKRNQIRKIDLLERIVKYAFDNVGQTFSALNLSKYLKSQNRKIDPETIYSYLEKLEKAYILHRCSRYDIRGKEILKTREKFYLADIALRHALLGYRPDSISIMMENVIYIELLSRGYDVYVGKLDQAEIDFIATRQAEKIYIQVTYAIESTETMQREYDRLMSIKDNYPKYVIRMDDLAGGNHDGILTMHLRDFLLSESW